MAAVWKEVWEESAASSGAGLRLHMAEVLALVLAGLTAGQWGRKKAAAAAVSEIARVAPDALAPHAPALAAALLKVRATVWAVVALVVVLLLCVCVWWRVGWYSGGAPISKFELHKDLV